MRCAFLLKFEQYFCVSPLVCIWVHTRGVIDILVAPTTDLVHLIPINSFSPRSLSFSKALNFKIWFLQFSGLYAHSLEIQFPRRISSLQDFYVHNFSGLRDWTCGICTLTVFLLLWLLWFYLTGSAIYYITMRVHLLHCSIHLFIACITFPSV